MPKKSCALGPPQAMMKRTILFSVPQAKNFFATVLCKQKDLVHDGHGGTLALGNSP